MTEIKTLKLNELSADPDQPRQEFDPNEMKMLERSIEKQGILVPIAVEKKNGTYLIVDGERRFRASQKLKLKELPVVVHKNMSEVERMVFRFNVQEQHNNWSAFDKAVAITGLVKSLELSHTEVADLLGLSVSSVTDYMALLSLSTRTRSIAVSKRIPFVHLRRIATLTKRLESVTDRKALESSLIDKVESGVILRAVEYSDMAYAIKKDPKIVRKLIDDPNYGGKQALHDVGGEAEIILRNVVTQSAWLEGSLNKAIKEGSAKLLDTQGHAGLDRIYKKLGKFLEDSGHLENVENV